MALAGPPIRVNADFIREKENILKFLQIGFGTLSLAASVFCYPSAKATGCSTDQQSFSQLFVIVCVNVFFLLCTLLLTVGHVLNIPDAYYRYNFPILERLYATLAAVMYGIATIIVFIQLCLIKFLFQWTFQMVTTAVAFGLYGYEAYLRWSSDYI